MVIWATLFTFVGTKFFSQASDSNQKKPEETTEKNTDECEKTEDPVKEVMIVGCQLCFST